MDVTEHSEEMALVQVQDLIDRVKVHVMPRRVRCKEFFNDFDPLRSGRCTEVNFARALNMMGMRFSELETDALAAHFTEFGPQIIRPHIVNYVAFCSQVDEVFASEQQAEFLASGMMTSSPCSTVTSNFRPKTLADEESFMDVLHRLASLCNARGVAIKFIYYDIDKTTNPSPSMLSNRRGGKVTQEQFIRAFPFHKEMSKADIDLLCEKFRTPSGDIHYMALHNEVSEVADPKPEPFPTSPLHLRPDETQWAHGSIGVVDRIRAKVVEKRMRLKEHFQDFDALRKGFCTPGQTKAVFTLLNLSKEIDKNDYECLLRLYSGDDGLFNYQAFVDDVDKAFTTPHLELDPLAVVDMPSALTTSPARRNPMKLDNSRMKKIAWVEDKVATFVRKRGVDLKPMFVDFDRAHRGYISVNQFRRIMSMIELDLDGREITNLCGSYCDLGNHNDFNWVMFLKKVDPPRAEVETAMVEMTSPFIAFKPKPYFDKRGKVLRKSMSVPLL